MKYKTTTSGNVNPNYIPSYTSPRGGRRACLCKDELTYKIECCTGELHAQGIGVINRTS